MLLTFEIDTHPLELKLPTKYNKITITLLNNAKECGIVIHIRKHVNANS